MLKFEVRRVEPDLGRMLFARRLLLPWPEHKGDDPRLRYLGYLISRGSEEWSILESAEDRKWTARYFEFSVKAEPDEKGYNRYRNLTTPMLNALFQRQREPEINSLLAPFVAYHPDPRMWNCKMWSRGTEVFFTITKPILPGWALYVDYGKEWWVDRGLTPTDDVCWVDEQGVLQRQEFAPAPVQEASLLVALDLVEWGFVVELSSDSDDSDSEVPYMIPMYLISCV